mmetsp:Transcript_49254/g.80188  ORF Transcript_49254/g.80188 Transcript_49254/m.80188 type:complete len:88 (+) Transcript_49254:96-359(+)
MAHDPVRHVIQKLKFYCIHATRLPSSILVYDPSEGCFFTNVMKWKLEFMRKRGETIYLCPSTCDEQMSMATIYTDPEPLSGQVDYVA